MPLWEVGMVVAGLLLLYAGAEGLVKGAASLALRLGITPLIVGLTVVAFGTSAPELLVGVVGTDDIAVGNILGSNVANFALILGAAALVRPIQIRAHAIRRDMPVMVVATLFFVVLLLDGQLTRLNGVMLLVAMAMYLGYTYYEAQRDMDRVGRPDVSGERHWALSVLYVVLGIAALALGAYWMVEGAVGIAEYSGVSQLVIAITVVALGTSLPELATSLVAAWRDEMDLSVGNVIGSNVFNLLLVLGVVSVLGDVFVDQSALRVDVWVMLAVSVAMWPLLATGRKLSRWEGALLLAGYVVYVITLFLR